MYRWVLIIILMSTNLSSFAEEPAEIKDIQTTLSTLPLLDGSRIPNLLKLAGYYIYREPEKSAAYAEELVAISRKYDDQNSLTQGLRLQGQSELFLGKSSIAFQHLSEAINVANTTENPNFISVANRAMGVFYELILDYDKALEFYLVALKFARESNDPNDRAMVFNNIGNVLNAQGDYADANSYFSQSIEINKSLNNFEMEMNSTVGLGITYMKSGDLISAENTLKYVLNNEALTSGFTYSEAMVNLAHVSRLKGNLSEAIEQYEFVLSDANSSKYPPAVASAYLGLASTLEQTGQVDTAREVYQRGLTEFSDKTSVESEMALYEQYAALEYKEKQFEAAANIQATYIARRNEVQPITQRGLVSTLETLLNQERNVIKLQKQILENEREMRNTSWYFFGIIGFALVTILLVLVLRLRKQAFLRLESTNKVLKKASETDPLTGIGNRRYLKNRVPHYESTDQSLSFLLLDIDHFKAINDYYGHTVGDDILVTLANTVKKLCRKDELFARIGGEEFVVLLIGVEEEAAVQFAERIRSSIELMTTAIDKPITVSIGLSFGNIKDSTFDEMYKRSDTALYNAKNNGRNKVTAHKELA